MKVNISPFKPNLNYKLVANNKILSTIHTNRFHSFYSWLTLKCIFSAKLFELKLVLSLHHYWLHRIYIYTRATVLLSIGISDTYRINLISYHKLCTYQWNYLYPYENMGNGEYYLESGRTKIKIMIERRSKRTGGWNGVDEAHTLFAVLITQRPSIKSRGLLQW